MSPCSRRDFLFLLGAAALAACGKSTPRSALPAGSAVLALGDSLTFGYGAPPEAAYPVQLAALTGWQVANGGVSGDTSGQALARLPALLASVRPKLVLLGIGGNDFLRKLSEDQTRANIGRTIETAGQAGVPTVLIAQPYFTPGALFGRLSDHPMYAELAGQHQIPLLAGAWAEILGEDKWKSDAIHANAAGYRRFAEILAGFLAEQGFR